MISNSPDFAKKLKVARAMANLSQSELADKLGISDKTVSAYEQGRAIPPITTLQKIAEITDQSVDFFINNKGYKETPDFTGLERKLDVMIKILNKIAEKI